jgi:hypothetical protein
LDLSLVSFWNKSWREVVSRIGQLGRNRLDF